VCVCAAKKKKCRRAPECSGPLWTLASHDQVQPVKNAVCRPCCYQCCSGCTATVYRHRVCCCQPVVSRRCPLSPRVLFLFFLTVCCRCPLSLQGRHRDVRHARRRARRFRRPAGAGHHGTRGPQKHRKHLAQLPARLQQDQPREDQARPASSVHRSRDLADSGSPLLSLSVSASVLSVCFHRKPLSSTTRMRSGSRPMFSSARARPPSSAPSSTSSSELPARTPPC
jgi:hypothetical protein